MTLGDINFYEIFDMFMLLLIGIGPKIALVPFIDITAGFDKEVKVAMANTMVRTATVWALILAATGWFLMRLLHFSEGAVLIAGGIVLLLLSLHMLLSGAQDDKHEEHGNADPMQLALYPLAVPYMLNPVGIAVIVIASVQVDSILDVAVLIGLILLVALIDLLLFRNIDALAKYMDPTKMAITEAVFGVLLAALAVQMMVIGASELGIITLTANH